MNLPQIFLLNGKAISDELLTLKRYNEHLEKNNLENMGLLDINRINLRDRLDEACLAYPTDKYKNVKQLYKFVEQANCFPYLNRPIMHRTSWSRLSSNIHIR